MTIFQRFCRHFTRHRLIVVCLAVVSLQFVIYGCVFTLVHQFLNKGELVDSHDVTAIYHPEVKRYKFRALDYGDVTVSNSSYDDPLLRDKIASAKSKNPYFRYLEPNNATVYDVMFVNPPNYLQTFKNPCFTQRSVRSLNGHTLQHVYHLRCLPYFFVAGFTKCGTTDFHARLSQHALVTSGWTKEPHWWDNQHGKNSVLGKYLDLYQTATDEVAAYELVNRYNHSYHPTIIGDFTPRLVWHGSDWRLDPLNTNLTEPWILLPHKVRHLLPEAKVIVLIRNPTQRLYSDYMDFMVRYNSDGQPPSPAHFHQLVMSAIGWWKDCLATCSERQCAYDSPEHLPPLDSTEYHYWVKHAADRLRIGLYVVYIKEWLSVFHRDNVKVVTLEDYKKFPLGTLSTQVLPFLNLDPFTPEEEQVIIHEDVLNSKNVRLDPSLDQPMLNATQQALQHFYRPYNLRLFEVLEQHPHKDYV